MLIRAAVPADILQMRALAEQSDTAAHWSAREYEALFAPDAPKRVAIVAANEAAQDEIAGFVIARCADEEWDIENVVVARKFQRQGIGKGLVEELVRNARQADARSLLLEVRESNAAARALYAKLRFKEEGQRSRYYTRPEEDAVLLRLMTDN
jgi:ribosomal-protein-alanine N-acetyltransferase